MKKFQVKVFNPVTKTFKMVGPIANSAMDLQDTNKKACIKCWRTGLMVVTVEV